MIAFNSLLTFYFLMIMSRCKEGSFINLSDSDSRICRTSDFMPL